MSLFSNWNGKIIEEEKVFISPSNRSFRYGDGCFETMKVVNGNLLLCDLHFQRLFSSLKLLQFTRQKNLTEGELKSQINQLVNKNGHEELARVRLVVYRGDGGLYDVEDKNAYYIIQSWAGFTNTNVFNETGLRIGIFGDAKKTIDLFSSIKSNNYLGYAMAAMWAKEHRLDDALLMNPYNRVADATIANIFIVDRGIIKTPPLTEGCVNGVMRKYLLHCFEKEGLPHSQTEISSQDLLNASEVFLTNATYGMRWVQQIGNNSYRNTLSSYLHKKFIIPLFTPATF
ncbi:aminotransferase class IV [Segetibacter sp.]|jgi:branched-subunit amino acid aminotransferase/4-amino-4-deoxychorismate lyase|uniref:aminotransferase class IV n=1 Tax=Segetibacter sp. TaxID=2231182 RepID=UPI002615E753|nr:aminotransferase class IV [Segetibacter sp.]MCW3082002.1 hypothetical protein [Segetibacter sp.]